MTRHPHRSIQTLVALLLLSSASLVAQESQEPKPATGEAQASPKPPQPQPKAKPQPQPQPKTTEPSSKATQGAAKTTKPASKEATASGKAPKGTDKKTTKPKVNYNVGEEAPPVTASPKPSQPKKTPRKPKDKPAISERIDINTASKEDLKKLPGISDAEVAKIIAHRPYTSKAGLLVDAGLTGAQYYGIKDRVFAGGAVPPKR